MNTSMAPHGISRGNGTRRHRLFLLITALLLGISACADGPREIQIGAEECDHCRMMISEHGFATQLITDRGRPYVFDSVECMAEFLDDGDEVPEDRVRSLWVTDFSSPGSWVVAREAWFLHSETLRSPMGLNLSAYGTQASAQAHQAEFGGVVLRWDEVREMVRETTVFGGGHHGHGHGHEH